MRELQHFLADDFRRHDSLGLVREVVQRVEGWPFRQAIDQQSFESVHVETRGRRHGNDLGERALFAVGVHQRQQPHLLHEVDLVENQEHGRRGGLDQLEHVAVAPAHRLRHIDHQAQHIDFGDGLHGGIHHPHVHAMQRPVNARRVEEHHLRIGIVAYAKNARARRLRLVGHNGQLLANQLVQQRRLAGIGAANEGDETRLH